MKIIGALVWYDEQVSMLAPAVAGFARFCDTIVCVDGGYALYPKARARSHPNQAEAIMRTCEAAGAGCVIHRPRDVWFGNEVEKRNLSLRLAAPFCTDERNWIVVFDSDFHVLQADPMMIRRDLEETDAYVVTYTEVDGKDWAAEGGRLAEISRQRHIDSEWTLRTRSIYRWTDDLRFGPAHWIVTGTYDGVERHLWGPDMVLGYQHLAETPGHLEAGLVVYHRRQDRPFARNQAADLYGKLRDRAGVEKHGMVAA